MEKGNESANIVKYFSPINDPRIDRTKDHSLINIIIIAICAVICGAGGFVEIEEVGLSLKEWLKTFLDLPNGIPSHDTFGRVFSLINPDEFKSCFIEWIKSVNKITNGEVIAIDGKRLRRSYDKKKNKSAIHMISAWANCNNLILGQIKVDNKSNEITAIPKLLELLEIKGCIITIDAMGCQKKIAEKIINKKADYILAVKGNQPRLHEELVNFFDHALTTNFDGIEHKSTQTIETNHGRKETREYFMVSDLDWLGCRYEWKGLEGVGIVKSTRILGEKISKEIRYYIISFSEDINKFATGVRSHWGIENKLHWVLDVQLREDDSRIRNSNAPENFAILRHVALNLLKKEKTLKRGTNCKRLKAAVDINYREKVLWEN